MSDLTRPGGLPKEGDEVTVILITPDGEFVSTGTFESATWNTDWIEEPGVSWDSQKEYRKGETTLTLNLRRVGVQRVSPEVAQGRRMLKP